LLLVSVCAAPAIAAEIPANAKAPFAQSLAGAKNTKAMALEYLARHVPTVLKAQREDGAFFPFPEWKNPSRYHQYCFYPLAYLYATPEAGKFHRDPALLKAARASISYASSTMKPDGRMPVHSRGDYWGDALDEWWTYFALETRQLIGAELPAEENDLWSRSIRRSVEGCVQHVERTLADPKFLGTDIAANHFASYLLAVYRAGEIFAREDWRRLAESGFQRMIPLQQPGGYWSEGGGPTTAYNHITTWAISLYAQKSNNPSAWQAVRKAEAFHRAFTYPNGSPIETIDGRVRYHGCAPAFIPVGFCHSPDGQAYVQQQIASLMHHPLGAGAEGFGDGYLGYAFFTEVARHAGNIEAKPSPSVGAYTVPNQLAGIVRAQGWVCVASAIVNPVTSANRWWLERQQHLSVWHSRTDLIVGGGNTRNQPLFSTLVVEDADGKILSHLAKAAGLRGVEPTKIELALTIADEQVELFTEILDAKTVRLTALWRGPGKGRCVWQLPLWLTRSEGITAGGQHHALAAQPLKLAGTAIGTELTHHHWRVRWDQATKAAFVWPVLPFNPYKRDGVVEPGAAQGVLRIPLTQAQPTQVIITVQN
jgi:hypothetical protein